MGGEGGGAAEVKDMVKGGELGKVKRARRERRRRRRGKIGGGGGRGGEGGGYHFASGDIFYFEQKM